MLSIFLNHTFHPSHQSHFLFHFYLLYFNLFSILSFIKGPASEKRAHHIARVVGEAGASRKAAEERLFGGSSFIARTPRHKRDLRPVTISTTSLAEAQANMRRISAARDSKALSPQQPSSPARALKSKPPKPGLGSSGGENVLDGTDKMNGKERMSTSSLSREHIFHSKYFVRTLCWECAEPFKGFFKKV